MNLIKQLLTMNYSVGRVITPEYIVVHETDSFGSSGNAKAHATYWSTNANANSSVHFVVDDKEIYQLAEYELGKCWRCWAVGDNGDRGNITNNNTINIEICVNAGGDYAKARANCIELVKWLLPQVKLTPDKVVRHYDASTKFCPRNMMIAPNLWTDFKKQIGQTNYINNVTPSMVAPTSLVQKGSTGNHVYNIQVMLNRLGANLVIDGDFGNNTYNAVVNFQKANGLSQDGIVGSGTWSKLISMFEALYITPIQPSIPPVDTTDYKTKFNEISAKYTELNTKYNNLINTYNTMLSEINSLSKKYTY